MKRANKAFEKEILDTVIRLCYPSGNSGYEFVLGTKLGLLWVSPNDDWIACRFEDPEKARKVYTCNPHSGKYNFHGEQCVEDFDDFIEDMTHHGGLLDKAEMDVLLDAYNAAWAAKRVAWAAQRAESDNTTHA
jgi:hypothetical protein